MASLPETPAFVISPHHATRYHVVCDPSTTISAGRITDPTYGDVRPLPFRLDDPATNFWCQAKCARRIRRTLAKPSSRLIAKSAQAAPTGELFELRLLCHNQKRRPPPRSASTNHSTKRPKIDPAQRSIFIVVSGQVYLSFDRLRSKLVIGSCAVISTFTLSVKAKCA